MVSAQCEWYQKIFQDSNGSVQKRCQFMGFCKTISGLLRSNINNHLTGEGTPALCGVIQSAELILMMMMMMMMS